MKILVTGGSRGIGRCISNKFERNNHYVYKPTREELDLSHIDIKLPATDYDIIINNAGINPLNDILDISDENVMRVNYFSPFKIIQQCLPHMIQNRYGRIINIGSIWIQLAKPKRSAYSASKHALYSLSKSITSEYARYNILCNTISPGFIATDLTYQNNTEQELEKIVENIPVKRLGTPEEIANLVYQLTIENTFITGQNIFIDGGYSCTIN